MKTTLIIITLLIYCFACVELFGQFRNDFKQYRLKLLLIISLAAAFAAGGIVAFHLK